jgi:hypothetical protein
VLIERPVGKFLAVNVNPRPLEVLADICSETLALSFVD